MTNGEVLGASGVFGWPFGNENIGLLNYWTSTVCPIHLWMLDNNEKPCIAEHSLVVYSVFSFKLLWLSTQHCDMSGGAGQKETLRDATQRLHAQCSSRGE